MANVLVNDKMMPVACLKTYIGQVRGVSPGKVDEHIEPIRIYLDVHEAIIYGVSRLVYKTGNGTRLNFLAFVRGRSIKYDFLVPYRGERLIDQF